MQKDNSIHNPKRAFKGIWIEKNIWLDEDLSITEKAFLAEISSLDNEHGCFASNEYFARFSKLSKSRVSSIISTLVEKNKITSEIIYEGKQVVSRILRVVPPFENKDTPPFRKQGYPPPENSEDIKKYYKSKTLINTQSVYEKSKKSVNTKNTAPILLNFNRKLILENLEYRQKLAAEIVKIIQQKTALSESESLQQAAQFFLKNDEKFWTITDRETGAKTPVNNLRPLLQKFISKIDTNTKLVFTPSEAKEHINSLPPEN